MDADLITPGVICDRSIEDISPRSLLHYDRVHMFAGIGGWDLALKIAGWRHEPGGSVWTGSCPCQPFSAAGAGSGFADERHLWPAWQHLIAQCRPTEILGEQVSSKAADVWVDLVQADLEGMGYTFGCIAYPAASVGAPHIRDRNFWVASDSGVKRSPGLREARCVSQMRQGGANWSLDMREILDSPFLHGRCHPQPLLRRMDDGFSSRVVGVHAYGNAIVPQAAAEMIGAYLDVLEHG